jgi:hypothetical protein
MIKKRNISLGVFLLSLGAVWALANVGIINRSILDSLFLLWPLLLVAAGIVIIFRENVLVRVGVWLLLLAVLIGHSYFTAGNTGSGRLTKGRTISIRKPVETQYGEIELSIAGTVLNIGSGAGNLVDMNTDDPDITCLEDYKNNKEKAILSFKSDRKLKTSRFNSRNESFFNLNGDVVWDIDVNVGAVSGAIDISELNVKSLDIDAGACDLKLICGGKYESTDIKIDAGASKIDLVIQKETGARIKLDGIMSKKNLDDLGWEKTGGYYISPNYNSAGNKVDIDINIGAGNLTVDIV